MIKNVAKEMKPQIGDIVYGVHEFLECKILEGKYDTAGYEIVEETVKKTYEWKKCGMGVVAVWHRAPVSKRSGLLEYYKPAHYGTVVFQTFEEAAEYAEELTRKREKLWYSRKMYRHWKEDERIKTFTIKLIRK